MCPDPKFWAKMIEAGARLDRFEDTRESAMRLISKFKKSKPLALQIQQELVDEGMKLLQTSAGVTVNDDIEELKKFHQKELGKLQHEMEEARVAQDQVLQQALAEAREDSQKKLDKIREQQDVLQYEARAKQRRDDARMEDLERENQKMAQTLNTLNAQNMNYEQMVAQFKANEHKLRQEQREAYEKVLETQQKNESQKKSSRGSTVGRTLLMLVPALGLGTVMLLLGMDPSPAVGMASGGGA